MSLKPHFPPGSCTFDAFFALYRSFCPILLAYQVEYNKFETVLQGPGFGNNPQLLVSVAKTNI